MLTLVVAVDKNFGIGKNGKMPWHIPEEFKHFKKYTLGKPLIMGDVTFENLPTKLEGRRVIVISNNPDYYNPKFDNAIILRNLQNALINASSDDDEYILAGGRSIYLQGIQYCDKLVISHLKDAYDCDTFLPIQEILDKEFIIDNIEEHDKFNVVTYIRK